MSYSPSLGRWAETDPLEYKDASNLYEANHSAPLSYVDPTGGEGVPTTLPAGKVPFQYYTDPKSMGVFGIAALPQRASVIGQSSSMIVNIEFWPHNSDSKCIPCKKIRFVQMARWGYQRKDKSWDFPLDTAPVRGFENIQTVRNPTAGVEEGWIMDFNGYDKKGRKRTAGQPVSKYFNDHFDPREDAAGHFDPRNHKDRPTSPARMNDRPSAVAETEGVFDAETYAFCEDQGSFMGGIRWGFYIDKTGMPIMKPTTVLTRMSPTFESALGKFNNYFGNPIIP